MSAKKKATVKQLQELTGYLNFLSKVIFPGKSFTRHMYSKFSDTLSKKGKLKKHHHIQLDKEFRFDCEIWQLFLSDANCSIVCRPMVDLSKVDSSMIIGFFTDASGNYSLAFGGLFDDQWFFGQWDAEFMNQAKPSIAYMELFALTAGILIWTDKLKNKRITIHCDNQSVVQMINNTSSSCKNCMYLIQLIVLTVLIHNRRVFATYVSTKDNGPADSLSRLDFPRFHNLTKDTKMEKFPVQLPREIWPISRIWQY